MRYFIAFLFKNSFFFFFLILEVIAFLLLLNYNRYHSSVIINATNNLTGSLHKTCSNISDYFSLHRQNEFLAEENARLMNLLDHSRNIEVTPEYSGDSMYRYISAKVIDNSTNLANNYIMIDKGYSGGIRQDMGVVSAGGVVGIVVGVSDNYSIVMSALHGQTRISAIVSKNNQLGNIVWGESDCRFGTLEDIPAHVKLEKGDTIVTSGFSFVFPGGFLIGTVEDYKSEREQMLNKALIRFGVDFNILDYVYVVEDMNKAEKLMLKQEERENE